MYVRKCQICSSVRAQLLLIVCVLNFSSLQTQSLQMLARVGCCTSSEDVNPHTGALLSTASTTDFYKKKEQKSVDA